MAMQPFYDFRTPKAELALGVAASICSDGESASPSFPLPLHTGGLARSMRWRWSTSRASTASPEAGRGGGGESFPFASELPLKSPSSEAS